MTGTCFVRMDALGTAASVTAGEMPDPWAVIPGVRIPCMGTCGKVCGEVPWVWAPGKEIPSAVMMAAMARDVHFQSVCLCICFLKPPVSIE